MGKKALRAWLKQVEKRATDAKAEVAQLFFDGQTTPRQHDLAGHADRALRDVLSELREIIDGMRGGDGDGQLRLLTA